MTEITPALVRELIGEQFPRWKELDIRPVPKSGHDNRTFLLGSDMTVRLPSGPEYAPQIEKEIRWLPLLSSHLSLPISCPIAAGKPSGHYPFPWSVNRYLEGTAAAETDGIDKECLAADLSSFLKELQSIETEGAPEAGKHNFYRGAGLSVYSRQVEEALRVKSGQVPVKILGKLWEQSLDSTWEAPPVWLHGDVAPGNLLLKNGRLSGVIDFGIMGIGDPACDYAMAWTFFEGKSRRLFLKDLDSGTIARARGWALWKALITLDAPEAEIRASAEHTLRAVTEEQENPIREEKDEHTNT